MESKIFKYKLDTYYLQLLMYLITFLIYVFIKGQFIENKFEFIFKDPILLIVVVFILIALFNLILNLFKSKKIVITNDRLILRTRTSEKEILFSEISSIKISKEKKKFSEGRFKIAVVRTQKLSFPLRIKIKRYEKSRELLDEVKRISSNFNLKKNQ